jgi:hypothetical protein
MTPPRRITSPLHLLIVGHPHSTPRRLITLCGMTVPPTQAAPRLSAVTCAACLRERLAQLRADMEM